MFCFVVNGVFIGMWGNNQGDIFFEATCKSMKWEPSQTSLYFFENFNELNTEDNVFEFNNGVMEFFEAQKDLDGGIVGKGQKLFEIQGIVYAQNGLLSLPC